MQVRSTRGSASPDPHQLSIFDLESAANDGNEAALAPKVAKAGYEANRRVKAQKRMSQPTGSLSGCAITIDDLPAYPNELVEQVDGSIANLCSEKLWFTYNDIRRCFGISRATVARRMKDGLVPGVRFQHGRILEDGAVRRFDRQQLRWLLLAVQCGPERVRYTAPASLLQQ